MFDDVSTILILVLIAGLTIAQILSSIKISKLNKKLMKDKSSYKKMDIQTLADRADEDISVLIEQNYKQDIAIENSFSRMGIEYFDAFGNMGGKLSFSMAFLNNIGDGFILTSIHHEEGSHVYMKEVKKGVPYLELSVEEKVALNKALDVIVINDLEIR